MELLVEMNDDVKGSYRAEDPASVLATDPGFFSQFTLVIATQMPMHVLAPLAALLHARNIPLVVSRGCCTARWLRVMDAIRPPASSL
jgi:amyloid beta precursor protein binding protein 1